MKSHLRDPKTLEGRPDRLGLLWERCQREIDPSEAWGRYARGPATAQLPAGLLDRFRMTLDLCHKLGPSCLDGGRSGESLNGEVGCLRCYGKRWLPTAMIRSRKEWGARRHVCQRGKAQIGEAIRVDRRTVNNDAGA